MFFALRLLLPLLAAILLAPCELSAQVPAGVDRPFIFPPGMIAGGAPQMGPDGILYGTAFFNNPEPSQPGGFIYRLTPDGVYRVLRAFPRMPAEGATLAGDATPLKPKIVLARNGTIYGTAGGYPGSPFILFSLSPSGVFHIRHEFQSGGHPRLQFMTPEGDFYFLTDDAVYSRVLRLSQGEETVVATFDSWPRGGVPGDLPPISLNSLMQASDGKIYGTSFVGGTLESLPSSGSVSYGTAFRLEEGGTATILLKGDATRANPTELIEAPDGSLYCRCFSSVVVQGGAIVRVDKNGAAATTIHQFANPAEGLRPVAMALGLDGYLYGATAEGGTLPSGEAGEGTLFRLSPAGDHTVLQTLDGTFTGYSSRVAVRRDGQISFLPTYRWDATPPASSGVETIVPSSSENALPIAEADVRRLEASAGETPVPMTIPVLQNDRDGNQDTLRVLSVSPPRFGTATVSTDGLSILYTPPAKPRSDLFTYLCDDGHGGKAQAQVFLRRSAPGAYVAPIVNLQGGFVGWVSVALNRDSKFRAKLRLGEEERTVRGELGMRDSFTSTLQFPVGPAELNLEFDPLGTPRLVGLVRYMGQRLIFRSYPGVYAAPVRPEITLPDLEFPKK